MIYTVSLNQSHDYHITLSKFRHDDLNRTEGAIINHGEKRINISFILSNFAVSSLPGSLISAAVIIVLKKPIEKSNEVL